MAICNHLAPNGEKSILYASLEQKYGPEKAHDVWTAVRSQQFLNKYGDWTNRNELEKKYGKDVLSNKPLPSIASQNDYNDNFNNPRPTNQDEYDIAEKAFETQDEYDSYLGNFAARKEEYDSLPFDVNGEPLMSWIESKGLIPGNESKDGKFKPANKEQADAIVAIRDFIDNGNPSEWLTVSGKAGTGKTTIVQEAIADAVDDGKRILVAALSHKAKLVLSNKLVTRFGAGRVKSYSIAGSLAMGMDTETGKFSPEFGNPEKPIESADVIIIDEASMVNEEALSLIMDLKRSKAKVIFLGDIGQLPPIREENDKNNDKPSPIFDTKNIVTLMERVRQGEESPLLPYADVFWNNSQSAAPVKNPATPEMRVDKVTSKGSIIFSRTLTPVIDGIISLFKESVSTNNPDIVRIVVYRNATREALNTSIRNRLFGENPKQIIPGELMQFQDNYTLGSKTISNATEIQVQAVTETTVNPLIMGEEHSFKVWRIQTAFDGKPIEFDVLSNEDKAKHTALITAMFAKAKAMPKGMERNMLLNKAWDEKKRFAPIDYSYAITSHKSQGSTYNTVVVGESDIMGVGPTSNKSKSQSIYVGLTRATTTAIIVDGITPANEDNIAQALKYSHEKLNAEKASQTTVPTTKVKLYQGYNNTVDDREFNYFTEDQSEAKDYGKNVREVEVDTEGFLKRSDPEYNRLFSEFAKATGKYFDILNNSEEGLKTQHEFFSFLRDKGYKGYESLGGVDNRYAVTFKPKTENKQELGVYEEYGTFYRFSEEDGSGEFRQGKHGDWKPLNAKTTKAKHEQFIGPFVRTPVGITTENTYEGPITSLKPNEIFVFGANPVGVNGNPSKGTGGAALVAHKIAGVPQGEKMDNRLSNSGKAWGITTVTKPGAKLSKTPEEIQAGIKKMYDYAAANPEKRFLVAYDGLDPNKKSLNGYTAKQMAEMFHNAGDIPGNVIFEKSFKQLVESTEPRETISTTPEQLKKDVDALVAKAVAELKAMPNSGDYILGFHGGRNFDKPDRSKQYSGEFRNPDVKRIAESMGSRYDGMMLFYTEDMTDPGYPIDYAQAAKDATGYAIKYGDDNPAIHAYLIPRSVADFGDRGIGEVGVSYDDIESDRIRKIGSVDFTRTIISPMKPSEFTNHSGGALGGDSEWDRIGRGNGFNNHIHYYHGKQTPKGNTPLNEEQIAEGIAQVKKTYDVLGRPDIPQYYSLHGRNWFQVKGADAVYAIGDILNPGDFDKPNSKGKRYANEADKQVVGGGTGYAVEMAIQAGKPVYVYNQNTEGDWGEIVSKPTGWYKWDTVQNEFVKVDTPTLTKNYAGIGTREINGRGKVAIDEVFKKTLREGAMKSTTETIPMLKEGPKVLTKQEKDLRDQQVIQEIIDGFKEMVPVEFINYDENQVLLSATQLLIPKLNADGQPDGYFTPAERKDIINSIVSRTERLYRKDPNLKANSILKVMAEFKTAADQLKSMNSPLYASYASIYDQRVRITEDALRQLTGMGLYTNEQTVERILNAVRELRTLSEEEKADWQAANPDVDISTMDEDSGEFLESTGKMVKDWSENSFELDPRDTASARIKLYLGTLWDMDRGVYTVNPDGVKVNYKEGDNLQRIAEQVSRKGLWTGDQESSEKLVELLKKQVPRFPLKTFLNTPKVAQSEKISQELLITLGDKPQDSTFEDFMNRLAVHNSPTIQQIAMDLSKADQSMKNEFMVVMMKQYQPFYMVRYNKKTDADSGEDTYTLQTLMANRFNQRDTLVKQWQEESKLAEMMVIAPDGERVLDTKRVQEKWIPIMKYFQSVKDWTDPEVRASFVNYIGGMFRLMGMKDITDEMMHDLFQNPSWIEQSSLAGMFDIDKAGRPTGRLSIFIMKAAGLLSEGDINPGEDLTQAQLNNPMFTEGTLLKGLANLAAKYIPVIYSNNHTNTEGKNVWDWGLNSKLSHEFREFKNKFETFAAEANSVHFSKNNWLLSALQDTPGYLNELELGYFDGLKPVWGKKGTIRQKQSDREQLLMALGLFQNDGNGFNKTPKVHYLSLTHSDKTTTPIFRNMPRLAVGNYRETPADIIGNMDSKMFNVFKSEYDRILNTQTIDYNNSVFNAGKGLFYLLPDFNYDSMQDMVVAGTLTQNELDLIWPAGQLTRTISSDRELVVINKVLSRFLNNLVRNTYDTWKEHGIINAKGNMFSKNYTYQMRALNGIRKEGSLFRDANKNVLTLEEVNKIAGYTAAKDYAINSWLFNTATMQLFYGDPAEIYKASSKGTKSIDHVRSTMEEYAKRLAKDIAPRADLYWEGKRDYNMLALADVMTKDAYLKGVNELRAAYVEDSTKSTDAQEMTTVEEKLNVLKAAGKIPSKTYDEMMAIVKNPDPDGFYEFKVPEHLAIIMQPEKPVYAGRSTAKDGVKLTTYVKSSAWALYPPFTKNKEIDKLRLMMERNNIQRADFKSGIKIGNPSNLLVLFDANYNYIEPTPETIAQATVTLSRDGFGIQQEVPYEEDKEAIKILTQMNDNITEGIYKMDGFTLPDGRIMNGSDLKKFKEDVRKEMISYNLQRFRNKLNIDENEVVDIEFIYDLLEHEARTDKRSSYSLNEIQSLRLRDKDGSLMLALMFNPAVDKFEGLLMGMVNKIAEIKMPGKSYVQASSVGLKFKDESEMDRSKVIRVGTNWDGSALKTARPGPDGKILPAQVVMPFNFFDKDGNKLNVNDFLKPGTNEIDTDRLPVELLQGIGGRIPNQKHSSMLPYEIVGFTDDNMGDIVFVPGAIVKQMGADFDVDKLYGYKRPYVYDGRTKTLSLTNDTKTKTRLGADDTEWVELKAATTKKLEADGKVPAKDGRFDEKLFNQYLGKVVKEKYPDGNVPKHVWNTETVRTFEGMQQDYFNIHWSILTHPNMLVTLLAPLDKPDLKNESKLLKKPSGSYYNYADPMNQLADFQSAKDAKTLVGSTSWATKLNARMQDKNLLYGELEEQEDADGRVTFVSVPATIQLLDEHSNTVRELGKLSGSGVSYYTEKDGGKIDESSVRTKSDNHVMVQSESVDNAKDRTLDNLNLNPETYKAVQALIQLQTNDDWAANSKYWTRLITQPIIWEFSKEMKQGNDSFTGKYDPNLYQTVISNLLAKYSKDLTEEELDKSRKIVFSPQRLLEAQTSGKKEHQVAALVLFDKLYRIGKRMYELEAQFTQDVSGAGRNLLHTLEKQRTLNELDQLPILNAMDLYRDTEVGHTFDATVHTAINVLSQIFPYRNLKPMFEGLMTYTGKTTLSMDIQKQLLRALRSSTFTKGTHFWNDAQGTHVNLLYGENSLAKRLIDAKNTWGKENEFLARLNPEIGINTIKPDFIVYRASKTISEVDKQNMSSDWLHLLLSKDETQRKLGEDLLRYAYLSGGIQDANSFIQFIPTSYIATTPFAGMLKDTEIRLKENKDYRNDPLLIQFIQHNPEVVPQLDQKQFGDQPKGQEYPEMFEINLEKFGEYANIRDADGKLFPFISYRSRTEGGIYKLYTKVNIGNSIRYVRMDTLGNKFTDEYKGDVPGGVRSILIENRSMAEQYPTVLSAPISALNELKNIEMSRFNVNVSPFERIGVKSGGEAELQEALVAISNNPVIPEYLRIVAKYFQKVGTSSEQRTATHILNGADIPLKLHLETDKNLMRLGGGTTGGGSNFRNEVKFNASSRMSDSEAAETFLHEIGHNKLQSMILLTGHDNRWQAPNIPNQEKEQVRKSIEDYRRRFPKIADSIDALERIRYEALNAWRLKIGEEEYKRISEKIDSEDYSDFGPMEQMYYALGTLQEFVVFSQTNVNVIEHLNNTDSSRGTLFTRLWDGIIELFAAIAEMLGTPVREQGLLKEALMHIMKLQNMNYLRDVNFTSALLMGAPMKTITEEEAQQLAELGESVYGREAYIKREGFNWNIQFSNAMIQRRPLGGQRGKVLEELKKHLDAVRDARNRPEMRDNIAKRVELAQKEREVRDDINKLYQENNLDNILEIGRRQMQWVDRVIENPNSSAIDVNLAMAMNNTWSTLTEILYGGIENVIGGVDVRFEEMEAKARQRRQTLFNAKARKVLNEAYSESVTLTSWDYEKGLVDDNSIAASVLTLSRTKSALVQATAIAGVREANNRDEHITENTNRLQVLEKKMKAAGLTDAMLLQYDKETNQWGLVNRLSGDWFTFINSSRQKLKMSMDGIDSAAGLTDEQRNEKKKDAWNKYWDTMKANAIFVDIRKFLDITTGKKLSSEAFDAALKELGDKVGSIEYAKDLLKEAEEKYQSYLVQKDAYRAHLDTLNLTPEEILQKFEVWLTYNSPVHLLNRISGSKDVAFNSDADSYVVKTANPAVKNFFDEKFQTIASNPKMYEAYSEYREVLQEMISYLPLEVQDKLPENFLPIVPKDTANWLAMVFNKIRNWDTELLKALAATDQEEAMRERPDKIPLMYTHATGQTKDIDNRSTDMIRVLELFSMMALQHRYMGNVLDNIILTQSVLAETNRRRAAGEEGSALRHLQDALQYFKDAIVFKKPKLLEGKIDNPIYSLNPATQTKIKNEIEKLMNERKDLEQQILDENTMGNWQTDELNEKVAAINTRLSEIEKDARNIYGSKLIDHLISVNQLKALAFNPFSAVSNFTFGAISVHIYAQGGVDYTKENARAAWGIMTHSMKKYWMFNDEGDPVARKVFNVMKRVGTMGDVVDTQYGESNLSTKKRGLLRKIVDPFNWQRAGDYFTKGVLTVAMLKTKKIEVIEKATGQKKEISVWDSLGEDGNLNTELYENNEKWYSKDKEKQSDWNTYRDRIRKVGIMVFGNQDKNAPLMAKKNFIWRLAGQFRMSWFPEGIATRFKTGYYDQNLGRVVKGRWRTYSSLGPLVSGMVLCKQLLAALPGVKMDPFANAKITVTDPKTGERSREDLSEHETDMENMRKNFAGLAWTVSITAAILLLHSMGDDDEHKKGAKSRRRQLLINMLIRNQQDLMLYSSPSVFNTISGNFLPATQVLTDYWNAMKATAYYLFEDSKEEKDAFEKWLKKITKAFPYLNLYNKTETMVTRDLDKLQR